MCACVCGERRGGGGEVSQGAVMDINKFWLFRSFGRKDHIKEMKIAISVLLNLFMTSNELCNTGHAH